MTTTQTIPIPGTDTTLRCERDAKGRLVRLSAGERTYIEARGRERIVDDGLAVFSEAALPSGILRHVRAADERWTEEYLRGEDGRFARIDGVTVRRDDRGRVTACMSDRGAWRYAYAGDHLAVIDGPHGTRHVTRGAQGRPVRTRQGAEVRDIAYDAEGRRCGVAAPPPSWKRDVLGRLWAVVGPDGSVRATYLWDGFACLGRIDGPPGEPLAAVFCLDPTGTPVRVITRNGVLRIPRDAFGEALLDYPGVPGLYGGASYEGFFHLMARRLDPRAGAFDARDPWHGGEDDPRRADGYRGNLLVEQAPSGPYAVCQNDPVGAADPTGAISNLVWLLPSDLTWSLQNNLVGWFGIDLTVNWFYCLFGSIVQLFTGSGESLIKRFFDCEPLSSTAREGSWGIRRNGFLVDIIKATNNDRERAFTYQHLVGAEISFSSVTVARAFDPQGDFRPTLYGTILMGKPASGAPFSLFTSVQAANAGNWTRAGGPAEPVIPGSPLPSFPKGGLHFNASMPGVTAPQGCDFTELDVGDSLLTGTVTSATDVQLTAAPGAPPAVRVFVFSAPALPASAGTPAAMTVAGNTATITRPPGPAGNLVPVGDAALLSPSLIVGVTAPAPGSPTAPAVVQRLSLTVTLDRPLPFAGGGVQVVRIQAGGPAYLATPRAGAAPPARQIVTVLPQTTAGGPALEMPRFGINEIVQASWPANPGFPAGQRLYQVVGVEGTTLSLSGNSPTDPPLPAALAGLTVTRMVPVAPATGAARDGINGASVGAGGRQFAFDVWSPTTLSQNTSVAVLSGNSALPAVIATVEALSATLVAAGPLPAGAVTVSVPPAPATFDGVSFSVSGTAFTFPGATLTPGPNLVVVVPFKDAGRVAHGSLSAGTVVVPNDPDNFELDRHDSLVEHELRHTLQCAMWGPLLLSYFPLWILELGLEGFTDIELPKYSAYVSGQTEELPDYWLLTIADRQGIPFAAGDDVQISGGGMPATVKIQAGPDNKFKFAHVPGVPEGPVQVRRVQSPSSWLTVPYNILQLLTHGGILNAVAGTTWSCLLTGLFKIGYAVYRLIHGSGAGFKAAINDDGITLPLSEDHVETLHGVSQVTVKKDSSVVVRGITIDDFHVAHFDTAVPFKGEIEVAPYALHSPGSLWDWHDYFPATVPDAGRPARIKVGQAGGKTLTLQVFDRVAVADATKSSNTTVTAVTADGTVDLEDAPSFDPADRTFRIAKIDSQDPIGNMDSFLMTERGMGWMRWLFDPYGSLQYRLDPTPGTFWYWASRIGRYLVGSQSWTVIPYFGYYWLDNFANQPSNGHLSHMEQEASHVSGDTYSPLGILRDAPAVVGDIARYWHIFTGGGRTSDNIVRGSLRDTPGVQLLDFPRLMPFRLVPSPLAAVGTNEPNRGIQTDPAVANPGLAVPDLFSLKNTSSPTAPTFPTPPAAAGTRSFSASNQGWIPTSPTLERACGMYVAFSQPTGAGQKHRITIENSSTGTAINQAQQGREADEADKIGELIYDLDVQDVAVAVAGQTVNEGDTISLLQTQRATVVVTPNGERRYAVNLIQPATGAFLRRDPAPGSMVIVAQAQNTPAAEPVEISRFYPFDTASGSFLSGGLMQHGIHLPGDVHIPVRRFRVTVTNTLPFRRAVTLAPGDVVTTLHPGDVVFVLVPVGLGVPMPAVTVNGHSATPAQAALELTDLTAAPADVRAFIGTGAGVFKIALGNAAALTGITTLAFTLHTTGNAAALTASASVAP
jgi:hypothetical protein